MNERIYTIWQSPENRRLIDMSMCGITYPDKRYSIRRPHSPIACIEYVISGCGMIHADDQTHIVHAGDAYFLQPGQDQYYYADAYDPWKKIFINLSGPLLERLIDGYQLGNRNYYPALDIHEELNGILTLTCEQSGDNTAELVCLITRIFHKMHLQQIPQTDSAAYRIREILDRNAAGKFDFAAVCAQVSLSQSHCTRLFRKEFGLTPYAYFIRRKIDLAKSLLLNTHLPIHRIAHDLSFADEYYFSNVFKQKTGDSPRSYRNKKQAADESS